MKKSEKTELARQSAARKLGPVVIHTSHFVRSLFGYLLGETWTFPVILDLACCNDGTLMAREADSDNYLQLLCMRKALISAVLTFADAASLTPAERSYVLAGVPEVGRVASRHGF